MLLTSVILMTMRRTYLTVAGLQIVIQVLTGNRKSFNVNYENVFHPLNLHAGNPPTLSAANRLLVPLRKLRKREA